MARLRSLLSVTLLASAVVLAHKISFTFRVELQGTPLVVTYAGTLESNSAMKGTIDIGGAATGTFTAKRP